MQTPTRTQSSLGSLLDLTEATFQHLKMLGYTPDTLCHFRGTWRSFLRFAKATGVEALSVDLTEAFLASHGIPDNTATASASSHQRHLCMAMRVLLEYQAHGYFARRRGVMKKVLLPAWSAKVLDEFVRFRIDEVGTAPRTIRVQRRDVFLFLLFLDTQGVMEPQAITAEHLAAFMYSRAHLHPHTLSLTACYLRAFLRYLAMLGKAAPSLIERVPRIRVQPDATIPDVWTDEEVSRLLATVDRTSPLGKRDFAILLLAARLGMRAGDIRELRLEDLRWDEARLVRRQCKTGAPLELPLTPEVGEAIIDYLRHGRPASPHREVFLRVNAPFEPFGRDNNLHSIITTYRRRAGVALPRHSHQGLHSLRHTVATRLLEADTPLPVISAIMGHLSSESTRIYAKVDIAGLRQVALDPQEVTHG
jgi:integrase